MALFRKANNLLKQTVSKHMNSDLSVSQTSLFQAIRSMTSSSKLFVGGLSYNTDEMSLRDVFAKYGDVVEAKVILDRDTGRSRGFGFVTYATTEAASSAIQAFDGQELHGRRVRVNYASERPTGGGFGGGYGSGGGYNYGGQGGSYGAGGYQGGTGGYQGGNYGGYGGGNYPRGDGNFSGGGRGSQYPSEGGGFGGVPRGDGGSGGANSYPTGGGGFGAVPSGGTGMGGASIYPNGGGSCYGSADAIQSDGKYGGGDTSSKYSGNTSGFSSFLDEETAGSSGVNREPQGSDESGMEDDFGQDESDGNDKDDKDEPNDYVHTRG